MSRNSPILPIFIYILPGIFFISWAGGCGYSPDGTIPVSNSKMLQFYEMTIKIKYVRYRKDISELEKYFPALLDMDYHHYSEYLEKIFKRKIGKSGMYGILYICSNLNTKKHNRDYALRNFNYIRDPHIKVPWALYIFEHVKDPRVIAYLKEKRNTPEGLIYFRELLGPKYNEFIKELDSIK